MSQPQPYSPQHAFVADSATVPQFPGQSLDIEFQDVKTTTDQNLANLALIQRDDGAIANGIVTYDSLSVALQTAGLQPATLWITGTTYIVGSNVTQGGSLYRSLIAHTSGVFCHRPCGRKMAFSLSLGCHDEHSGGHWFRNGHGQRNRLRESRERLRRIAQ